MVFFLSKEVSQVLKSDLWDEMPSFFWKSKSVVLKVVHESMEDSEAQNYFHNNTNMLLVFSTMFTFAMMKKQYWVKLLVP